MSEISSLEVGMQVIHQVKNEYGFKRHLKGEKVVEFEFPCIVTAITAKGAKVRFKNGIEKAVKLESLRLA